MATPLFVSPEWLVEHLEDSEVGILDARMLPPGYQGPRNLHQEYLDGHLPGARFFDVEALSDPGNPLPHMLPQADAFARALGEMGIGDGMHLVIYDDGSLFSAPRVWWMLHIAGVNKVSLLAGGLEGWQRSGLPLARGPLAAKPRVFNGRFDMDRVRNLQQVQQLMAQGTAQLIDARPAPRFNGQAPEPRPGLRLGHIPGSLNVPWNSLVENGRLKSADALRAIIADAGVDMRRPIIASCGSGVTAAVAILALYALGVNEVALYDGSWSEWGGRDDTPVDTTLS